MADIDSVGIFDKVTTSIPRLGPNLPTLTTTYTAPPRCSRQWWQAMPDGFESTTLYSDWIGASSFYSSCLPSGTNSFSPGVCPSGRHLATVTQYRDDKGGSERLWAASCCVDGFTLDARFGGICTSYFTTNVKAFRTYTSVDDNGARTTMYEPGLNATELTAGWKFVNVLVVLWQSSDLSLFDPPYASALASRLKVDFTPTGSIAISASRSAFSLSASPSSTFSIPYPTDTYYEPEPEPGQNRSPLLGFIIGPICGVAILAAALYFLFRHIRRKKARNGSDGEANATAVDAPELIEVQNPAYTEKYRHEHEEMGISELPSPGLEGGGIGDDRIVRTMSELPSPVAELEGENVDDRGEKRGDST